MTERRKAHIHMAILALFFTLVILGCSSAEPATSEPAISEEVVEVVSEEVSEPEEIVSQNVRIEDGTFVVGVDFPAGEYVIFGNGNGEAYYELSNAEGKVRYGHFFYNDILTVENEQSLALENAYAVPIEDATVDTTQTGHFKVGTHIEAGEYIIIPNEDATDGWGSYWLETSSNPLTSEYIGPGDMFQEPVSVTLNEGEYIGLYDAHIATDEELEEIDFEILEEYEPTMGERNALESNN